ncbi:hypothetical protein ACIRPT_03160 [Streptomyces sp. NPDC101227]|uniref:hypothetical protein n=1 Tax=Streptomyces sp. NPDC101227 TaxID=3366136 RepID=UPI0038146356
MHPAELYPDDLVYVDDAERETGVPRATIRQWAARGKIRRYPGNGRPSGLGHAQRTMYALPEI